MKSINFSKKQINEFKAALNNLLDFDKEWVISGNIHSENAIGGNHEVKILKSFICSPKENIKIESLSFRSHGSKVFKRNNLYLAVVQHNTVKDIETGKIIYDTDNIIYYSIWETPEGLTVHKGYNIIKENDIKVNPHEAFNKYFIVIEQLT